MSKRYYLCDVLGDGSEDNQFRPAVDELGVNYSAVINEGRMQALVIVDTTNHARLLADQRINAMPDFPLDGKINALRNESSAKMNNDATRRGYSASWSNSAGYRDVLRSIGRELDLNFDEDNFGVSG